MSVLKSPSAHGHDDPRDASLETRVTLPKTWARENADGLTTSGLFLSGLVMVTRNRMMAWPALFFAINSLINQHSLRTKDGGQSPWSGVLMGVVALIAAHMPKFMVTITQSPPA